MRAVVPFAAVSAIVVMACQPMTPRKRAAGRGVTLAVLPAESSKFPRAAQALTDSLANASVSGVDRKQVSKVSLEVVQLSIECVDPSAECYAAVGKSLDADRLLFGQLSGKKKQIKVTVTLFDVDAKSPRTANKTFASEQAATAGVADLVAEATR